jgi:hypothetical protein
VEEPNRIPCWSRFSSSFASSIVLQELLKVSMICVKRNSGEIAAREVVEPEFEGWSYQNTKKGLASFNHLSWCGLSWAYTRVAGAVSRVGYLYAAPSHSVSINGVYLSWCGLSMAITVTPGSLGR